MLRSRLFHLKCRAHRQMGRALQTVRPIKWLHYGEWSKCCDHQGKFSHIFWMSIVYWAPVHSPYTLVLHLPNWLVVPWCAGIDTNLLHGLIEALEFATFHKLTWFITMCTSDRLPLVILKIRTYDAFSNYLHYISYANIFIRFDLDEIF